MKPILFLIVFDDFFEVWHGAVSALAAAVREDEGRCAVEAELFAQRSGFGNGIVAIGFAARELAFAHPVGPGLGRVGLAPQNFGFTRGIGVQARNRHHEVVDRDVGHFFKLVFQAFAVWAVGVGEDGDFQLAVAAYFFNRFVQRQGGEVDFVQIGGAFVGQAFARVDVDEVADEHIVAFGIGVNDLFAADDDFINALNRGFADADDFQALGFVNFFEAGFQGFADFALYGGGGLGG